MKCYTAFQANKRQIYGLIWILSQQEILGYMDQTYTKMQSFMKFKQPDRKCSCGLQSVQLFICLELALRNLIFKNKYSQEKHGSSSHRDNFLLRIKQRTAVLIQEPNPRVQLLVQTDWKKNAYAHYKNESPPWMLSTNVKVSQKQTYINTYFTWMMTQ